MTSLRHRQPVPVVASFLRPTGRDREGKIIMVYETSPLKPRRYRRTDAVLAELDEAIITAVAEDHPVSLRGVYYRVVSAGAVEKTEKGYAVVQRQLLKLRRAGRVPYGHIADGTRWIIKPKTWSDPEAALQALGSSYRKMLWLDQDVSVQIFSEKDAITGTVSGKCAEWDVPLGIVRGYASETFAYNVAMALPDDKTSIIYQLGDHDPSGNNAWEVFQDRITAFRADVDVIFERLAVTPEQIEELRLPTRPTKDSDPRSAAFEGGSVEVDAIRAPVLRDIVEDAITQWLDQDALAITREVERQERRGLRSLAGEWSMFAE